MTRLVLRAGLRAMPLTDPLLNGAVVCEGFEIEPRGVVPYTETFRLMARELAYDIAEMPLATQLLAVDAGKPLTALPIVLAGGDLPHQTLICLENGRISGPADLHGKRVGIRAYAQTTGVWLRGILREDYGLDSDQVTWLVTENSHIESFRDPGNVQPAPVQDLFTLLRDGGVDAIITSLHTVKDTTGLRTVIPDAKRAGEVWRERTGLHSVNHVLSVQTALLTRVPGIADKLSRCFSAARNVAQQAQPARRFNPYGDAANRKSIERMLAYAHEQHLTRSLYSYDDLFLPWPDPAVS